MSRRLTNAWGKAQWAKTEWGHSRNIAGSGSTVTIGCAGGVAFSATFGTKMRMKTSLECDIKFDCSFSSGAGSADIECAAGGQAFGKTGLHSSPLHDAPIAH